MKRYWWDNSNKELVNQKYQHAEPGTYTEIVGRDDDLCIYTEFYRSSRGDDKVIGLSYSGEKAYRFPNKFVIGLLLKNHDLSWQDVEGNPYLAIVPKEELKKMIKTYGFADIEEDNK